MISTSVTQHHSAPMDASKASNIRVVQSGKVYRQLFEAQVNRHKM